MTSRVTRSAPTMTSEQEELNEAIRYALKCGCLFEHTQEPRPPYRVADLVKWGAMRNLHTKIAKALRKAES